VANTQVPQLDVVRWRDQLRAIWQSDPGVVTAKITWTALYLQRSYLEELRATIKIAAIVKSLHAWDQQFAQYSARLARYREEILLAGEVADPLIQLTSYYADPVFAGRYGAIVASGDIAWPGFIQPSMPDAMVGASLFNQIYSALVFHNDLDTETKAMLGACAIPVLGTPDCIVAIGFQNAAFVESAASKIQSLGVTVKETTIEIVEKAVEGIKNAGAWVARTAGAAAEGGSIFIKFVGVALIAGLVIYIYNEAV